jgi:hypothetical protein
MRQDRKPGHAAHRQLQVLKTNRPGAIDNRGGNSTYLLIGLLEFGVFFSKALDTPCRVNKFLFPCKKRMAFGTDFHANVLFGRPDRERVAAGAGHRGFRI